jgi:ABC-type nitrate/sulfonate/bicarbonate transport system substrate-binding protein
MIGGICSRIEGENTMVQRKGRNVLLFVSFCLLLIARSPARGASATPTNFATSITGEAVTAVWIAKDRGFLRKHGLDARFILMPKSPTAVAALIAGEIDMAIIGPGHLLNAASSGANIVGIANFVQKLDYSLVGTPEVKTAETLRGKRVGIAGPGALSHIVALLALERLGLDANQAKIAFITIPGTEVNRRAALETKLVDAAPLRGSVADLYVKRGYSMLFNFKDSGVAMPQILLATTRRTISTKPDLVDAYLKGFIEAIAYLMEPSNKNSVMGIISSNLRLDSAAAAEEAYESIINVYERVPYPKVEGMKMLHRILGPLNPKLVQVQPESTVDNGPLGRLESSGFVRSVYEKP